MKISIIGCGWYGSQLAEELLTRHIVMGTSRDLKKLINLQPPGLHAFEICYPKTPQQELLTCEALVLNIPPQESHLDWFQSWNLPQNIHLIFISSTSIYGDHQGSVTELTPPVPDSSGGQILLKQEEWVRHLPTHTIIRFGGLLGKERHPGKYLSGKQDLPHGNWPVNLIHLDDCVGFTQLVIEKKLTGTFNLVSDLHESRRHYYTKYCEDHSLPLPSFVDSSTAGKIVDNKKIKNHYVLKRPLLA